MGGRGASAGISKKGRKYGTEHNTIYHAGHIKFIQGNENPTKMPLETMSRGRIYAVVNNKNEVHAIGLYDKHNKLYKQIDLLGRKHKVGDEYVIPHTHMGYVHGKHGTFELTPRERRIVANILKLWDNRVNKK